MNKTTFLKNYLVLALLLLGLTAQGQTIITDRPDQTESSSTIPKGSFQIEAGVGLGYIGINAEQEREILWPTALFRLGIIKALELRLVTQFASIKNKASSEGSSSIGDIELGAKVQILRNENINMEIAFLSHLVIPTTSVDSINLGLGTVNKLSIAHELGEHFGLGYNVGYNYFGQGKGILTYSVALGVGITDKVGVYIEPYGDLVNFEKHLANFDGGVTYLIQNNLQLDISYGFGMNHTMNYMAFGISWNISNENKR
jgi:hypothetical protein